MSGEEISPRFELYTLFNIPTDHATHQFFNKDIFTHSSEIKSEGKSFQFMTTVVVVMMMMVGFVTVIETVGLGDMIYVKGF